MALKACSVNETFCLTICGSFSYSSSIGFCDAIDTSIYGVQFQTLESRFITLTIILHFIGPMVKTKLSLFSIFFSYFFEINIKFSRRQWAKACPSLLYKFTKSMILPSYKSVLTGIHHLINVRHVKWTKKMVGQSVYCLTLVKLTKAIFTINFIFISTNRSPFFNAILLRLRHPAFATVNDREVVWNSRHMCSKRSNVNSSSWAFICVDIGLLIDNQMSVIQEKVSFVLCAIVSKQKNEGQIWLFW